MERTISSLQVTTLIFVLSCFVTLSVFPNSLHIIGCHFSLGNYEKTQMMLDMIPDLIDKKKISGKDLPTEVFIKKKRTLAY